MTCSILSAIMASTKVKNWARKPGWRIAAKDRLVDGGALTAADLVSIIKNHQTVSWSRVRNCPRGLTKQVRSGGAPGHLLVQHVRLTDLAINLAQAGPPKKMTKK